MGYHGHPTFVLPRRVNELHFSQVPIMDTAHAFAYMMHDEVDIETAYCRRYKPCLVRLKTPIDLSNIPIKTVEDLSLVMAYVRPCTYELDPCLEKLAVRLRTRGTRSPFTGVNMRDLKHLTDIMHILFCAAFLHRDDTSVYTLTEYILQSSCPKHLTRILNDLARHVSRELFLHGYETVKMITGELDIKLGSVRTRYTEAELWDLLVIQPSYHL